MNFRIGVGFDAHRFKSQRNLILAGVSIPHEKGLDGHSDADVLAHAVIDSILGALALGDIGQWFPDSKQEYKNADSLKLLEFILKSDKSPPFSILNLDTVVIAQAPKLAPYVQDMRNNLARILQIPESIVSVKATTTEYMGFCGRSEGIAAQSIVLLNLQ